MLGGGCELSFVSQQTHRANQGEGRNVWLILFGNRTRENSSLDKAICEQGSGGQVGRFLGETAQTEAELKSIIRPDSKQGHRLYTRLHLASGIWASMEDTIPSQSSQPESFVRKLRDNLNPKITYKKGGAKMTPGTRRGGCIPGLPAGVPTAVSSKGAQRAQDYRPFW